MPVEPIELNDLSPEKKAPSQTFVMMELVKTIKDLTEELRTMNDRIAVLEDKVKPATTTISSTWGQGMITSAPAQPMTYTTIRDTGEYLNQYMPASYTAANTAFIPINTAGIYTSTIGPETDEYALSDEVLNDDGEVVSLTRPLDWSRVSSELSNIESTLYNGLSDEELDILAEALDPNS